MNIVEAGLAVAEYQLINSEAVEGLVADCGLAEQDLGQSEEEERCGQAESVTLLPDISGILQTKSFFFQWDLQTKCAFQFALFFRIWRE